MNELTDAPEEYLSINLEAKHSSYSVCSACALPMLARVIAAALNNSEKYPRLVRGFIFQSFCSKAISNLTRNGLVVKAIFPLGGYPDAALGELKPKAKRQVTKPGQYKRRATDLYLTFNGEERSLHEWAKLTGIKYATLRHCLRKGWPVANILTEAASKNSRRPGVVFDFERDEGTGGGRSAQDRPEISFSPNEKVEA